jgi:L-ribulokinase
MPYSIGLDYGTNSVRCVVVNTDDGNEAGTAVFEYPSGDAGILLDSGDHNLARQRPGDYLEGLEQTVKGAIEEAKANDKGFRTDEVIGIGVDTTGSTPLPVDKKGVPLAFDERFKDNLNAQVWLWKDHTSVAEAEEITELASKERPEYLAKCGGTYSSEWFFSKLLHCLRIDKAVFEAAYTWVEHADWLTGILTGNDEPGAIRRCRCAAGHKAMFSDEWGGYPDRDFLCNLDERLGRVRDTLGDETYTIADKAGQLSTDWAERLGLAAGVPVAMGAFDAHLGAVGSGIGEGTMVKIMGTSCCDMVVWPSGDELVDIPGICGIVDGSILPGFYGLEAGQSAVGDIFNWFVNYIRPGGDETGGHIALTEKASGLRPGQSGLLALDWNNGNRTVLVDQRLTGLLMGQTLHTRPEEIYRALVEATAFGALTIINRFEEYGVKVDEIVTCGGISEKNEMIMQIYADVTGREMKVSRSGQTCALGAAVAGAVVGKAYDSFDKAQAKMCGVKERTFKPVAANNEVYQRLYGLYKQVHDGFGVGGSADDLSNIMKELLDIKQRASEL